MKKIDRLEAENEWLRDRMAIALTFMLEPYHQGVVLLPSKEEDRITIRGDEMLGNYYNKMQNLLSQVLREQIPRKADGSGRIPVRVKKRGKKVRRPKDSGKGEAHTESGDTAKDSH